MVDCFFPGSLGRCPHSTRERLHNPHTEGRISPSPVLQWDKNEHGINFVLFSFLYHGADNFLCLPYLASSLVFSVFVTGRRRRGSADRSRKKFSRSSPVMVRAGGQGAGSSSARGAVVVPRFWTEL
jgi:hypothetical protein